jgi:hypothetical protein
MGAVAAIVALAALGIWLYIALHLSSSVDVALIGADYALNLNVPHNVYGVEGLKTIESLATAPRGFELLPSPSLRLLQGRSTLESSDDWDRLIDELLRQSAGSTRPLVLFLALHGTTDAAGAYLLPNQATTTKDRLELTRVIDAMKRFPREKTKVLILEGAQVPADWQAGMLHNDFAGRLEELEPRIAEVGNLWVLSGCDVGQRCWVSDGLKRTIFTHYLIEGLSHGVAGSSRAINLADLHRFVRTKVRNWAWNARAALQEPVLLPRVGPDRRAIDSTQLDRRARRVVLSTPIKAFAAPSGSSPGDSTSVEEVWQGYQKLANLDPHPAVHSPRRWRLYRAAVVRYDELVRAGDRGHAETLRQQLNALERTIREERFPALPSSAENTLATSVLEGGAVVNPQAAPAGFSRYWNAPRADLVKVWQEVQAGLNPSRDEHFSPPVSWVDDVLLQRAEDDPVENLERAADRLLVTKKDNHPQPAEAHFLLMLQKGRLDLKGRSPKVVGLVTQALSVRRLAERAAVGAAQPGSEYLYSEQLLRWVQSLIEEADRERRLGEDLLFSTEEGDWERADTALKKARTRYDEAARRAVAVRSALATRDRVLSALPEYAQWLPHRPVDRDDGLLAMVQELWKQTHELARALRAPPPEANIPVLTRLAQDVAAGFEKLEQSFAHAATEPTRLREDWETATAAAAAAVLHPDALVLRRAISRRLTNIGKNDVQLAASDKGETLEIATRERESDLSRTRRRACASGRMALATLGQSWFDDPRFNDGQFEATWKRIEECESGGDSWWTTLAVAGTRVHQRWRELTAEADRYQDQEDDRTAPDAVRSWLTQADDYGRRAGLGAARLDEMPREAAARLRDVRVHDLLLWMARRTWLDHWADLDPATSKPYYQAAGSKYVDDANRLFRQSTGGAESSDARTVRELLEQKSRLDFDTPRPIVLTSEGTRPVAVSYRLVETGTVPPGIPVVSPRPGRFLEMEKDEDQQKKPLARDRGNPRDPAVEFTFRCPLLGEAERDPKLTRPRVEETTFAVQGFFRGQEFEGRVDVRIHPLPETVVIGSPPPDLPASIAVRADRSVVDQFGVGRGSIAIVLDCSGSMGRELPDRTRVSGPKFDAAKRALESALRSVPPGTTVSLLIFSHFREGGDQRNPNDFDRRAEYEPELTITHILQQVRWDPNILPGLKKRLDNLVPFYETPLVAAMLQAKQDLDIAQGQKTLLVITDGADSRFEMKEGQKIAPYLEGRFAPSRVLVNMVLLDVNEGGLVKKQQAEMARARDQFVALLKRLDPPGQHITVNQLDTLDRILANSLEQKLTCQITADGTTVGRIDVTAPDEPDRWFARGLAAGAYKLAVRTDRLHEQSVSLENGDRLLVKLAGAGGKLTFERALYSEEKRRRDPQQADKQGWRLAVVQNQSIGKAPALQILAALEPLKGGSGRLQQSKPRCTWFELAPELAGGPYAVRIRERSLYPAPVWQFDIAEWINDPAGAGPVAPVLRVWWKPDDEPADVVVKVKDQLDASAVADDGNVGIESIRAEDHYVENRPGAPPELTRCLVVRLHYPPGNPYWVDPRRLVGVQPKGFEHRFYTRAGKYTGLFWSSSGAQVNDLQSLGLVSLSSFRKRAERDGNAIELKLSQPVPDARQPDPPRAVLGQ